jgi:formylmethanofuran dehydrogenase subunit C
MSGWRLTLKQAPALRVDMRGVTPAALGALNQAQVAQLQVGYGKHMLPLGEWFSVTHAADDQLQLIGDLSRFDRVGWELAHGHILVDGNAGHCAGGCMRGGTLHVQGHALLQAACEMAGGQLVVDGNVGDFAASTLPGSMDGMRGGCLIVKGNAGARFADRMRRGTAIVCGDAGDFLASRMVAGTVLVAGRCGAHVAYGMRRGSVVLMTPGSAPTTFVPAQAPADVTWQLLSRELATLEAALAELPRRRITRALGDVAVAGKGELIFVS